MNNNREKMRKTDIVLSVRPMGKFTYRTSGLMDYRIFKGENQLHAIMDMETCLWRIRYETGIPPLEVRNQQFTSFSELMKYLRPYLKARNLEIVEILD